MTTNPEVVILGIPRPFDDAHGTKNDALDFKIAQVPLLNYVANLFDHNFKKITVVQTRDKTRIEKLGGTVLYLDRNTQGALATLALAVSEIGENAPILVQPFDSIVSSNILESIETFEQRDSDVGLITLESDSPELSYVRVIRNTVLEIAEKNVMSNTALTGVFYFKSRKILLDCIKWSLLYRIKTNEKYFIAPSINAQIALGRKIHLFNIDKEFYFRFTSLQESQTSKERLEKIYGD